MDKLPPNGLVPTQAERAEREEGKTERLAPAACISASKKSQALRWKTRGGTKVGQNRRADKGVYHSPAMYSNGHFPILIPFNYGIPTV